MSSEETPQKITEPVRVLIADDEVLLAQRLADYLNKRGFLVKTVRGGNEAKIQLEQWLPNLVLYDLMLPEANALQFLKSSQTLLTQQGTKVVVVSGHNDPRNSRECLRSGAIDYIQKPFQHAELLNRLVMLLRAKNEIPEYKPVADSNNAQYFIHLTDLTLREVLKGASIEETLFNLVGLVGLSFGAVRASLISCPPGSQTAKVIAANDNRHIGNLEIEMKKYPEIQYVVNNDKLLALDNLASDPTMQFVSRVTKMISFNSMLVAPVRIHGRIWGVLSLRLPETRKTSFSAFEVRFSQLAANVMGTVILREPKLLHSKASTDSDNSGRDPLAPTG